MKLEEIKAREITPERLVEITARAKEAAPGPSGYKYEIRRKLCWEDVPDLIAKVKRLRERDKAVEKYYQKFYLNMISYKRRQQDIKLMERFEQMGGIIKKAAELSMECDALKAKLASIRKAAEPIIMRSLKKVNYRLVSEMAISTLAEAIKEDDGNDRS